MQEELYRHVGGGTRVQQRNGARQPQAAEGVLYRPTWLYRAWGGGVCRTRGAAQRFLAVLLPQEGVGQYSGGAGGKQPLRGCHPTVQILANVFYCI